MSREESRHHQRVLEELRQTRAAVEARREPWYWSTKTLAVIGILSVAVMSLYLARPSVEAMNVVMVCPLCDQGGPFTPPPTVEIANQGATMSVTLQNTGSLPTELIDHNLSTREFTQPSPKPGEFIESPDASDHIPMQLGSHSSATISISRGEVVALALRHYDLLKIPPPNSYLYGHATYKVFFLFHSRTDFCFHYIPPTKGLPEKWSVCSR